MTKAKRMPLIGSAFDGDFMNDAGRIASYVAELRYYRPRGSAALASEGDKLAAELESANCGPDAAEWMDSWINEVEDMLTTWARKVMRNDYVWFGPFEHCGSVGFCYALESALEDCDLKLDAGDRVPTGFSGMAAFVTDHGNVTVQRFSRGRMTKELATTLDPNGKRHDGRLARLIGLPSATARGVCTL